MIASFGLDETKVMRSSDLQDAAHVRAYAPANSYLLNIGFGDLPSLPPSISSSTAQITYAELNDTATQANVRPVAADLVALLKRFEQKTGGSNALESGRLYAIWSPVESYYGKEYGLERSEPERPLARPPTRKLVVASGVRRPRHISVPSRGDIRRRRRAR